jgi:hypothetical protein
LNETTTASTTLAPSLGSLLLSVGVLVALLLCIYAVFFFGRKLQSDAYRRASLVEAVTAQEKENRCNALESVKRFRPLDEEKNPLPEAGKYDQWYFWDHQQELFDLPDKPKADATKEEIDDWKKKQALAVWGRKELLIFRKKLEEIEGDKDKKIRTVADKFVPKAADISVLGGGFSFLLEFSTVIVIIFALVILGILGTLQGNEISAILAAIAGYVLGKASASVQAKKQNDEEKKKES